MNKSISEAKNKALVALRANNPTAYLVTSTNTGRRGQDIRQIATYVLRTPVGKSLGSEYLAIMYYVDHRGFWCYEIVRNN